MYGRSKNVVIPNEDQWQLKPGNSEQRHKKGDINNTIALLQKQHVFISIQVKKMNEGT